MTIKRKMMNYLELQLRAKTNKEEIHAAIYNVRANFLVLGKLLKENRDDALWKLEYDSFEALLGDPQIGLKRSTAYGLIQIVELYLDKLGIPPERILSIGNSKLLAIAPVVESDKEGWLAQAEALSKSDLKIQIAEAGGKQISPLSPPSSPPRSPLGCVVCGAEQVDRHHFPVTRGAGCPDHWTIPLCRLHHSEYHHDPKEWTWENRRKWAEYFYERVSRD